LVSTKVPQGAFVVRELEEEVKARLKRHQSHDRCRIYRAHDRVGIELARCDVARSNPAGLAAALQGTAF
jgi:hypothetical protein